MTDPEQSIPMLPSNPNATTGLNILRTINSLYVKQNPSLSEIVFGVASEAKFDIFNDRNERILQALETSTFCQRLFCAQRRRFTLRILDNFNQEIILLKREFKCCSGCSCCANIQCCSQEIVAESPPGTHIGTVSQIRACCRSLFELRDAQDNHQLTLKGPYCIWDGPASCCCSNQFLLTGTDGITEIGSIQKKYRGFLAEATSSADAYFLQFPMDLDVKMKALALASLFLVEYMIFAAVPSKNSS